MMSMNVKVSLSTDSRVAENLENPGTFSVFYGNQVGATRMHKSGAGWKNYYEFSLIGAKSSIDYWWPSS